MAMTLPMLEPKTESLTFRISPHDKRLLEEAVTKTGSDLTRFILGPALELAREIAEREAVTFLNGAAREQFIELFENPSPPSERLIRNLHDTRHEIVE